MGKRRAPDLKYITLADGGYMVRIQPLKIHHWFGAQAHGNYDEAFAAAIKTRDRLVKELKLPEAIVHRTDTRSTTGVVGLSWTYCHRANGTWANSLRAAWRVGKVTHSFVLEGAALPLPPKVFRA